MVGRPRLPTCGIDVAPVDDGVRVSGPHEGPSLVHLVLAVDLDGVVRTGRPEVAPPLGVPVVAVRAGVDEQLDAVVTDLDRQRVGVAVRGDGEEPVGAAVAAAPDLGPSPWGVRSRWSPASANAQGATAARSTTPFVGA